MSCFKNNPQGNVWITGDIHGDPMRFHEDSFYEQRDMTYKDKTKNFVIICGDAALLWYFRGINQAEEDALDWLDGLPFTVLFVDGNHENFNRLNELPVSNWHGGRVHKLRDSVIHLMRGEIFDIANHSFFTFGGASSHDVQDGILDMNADIEKIKEWSKSKDKFFRIKNVNWWKEELPNENEMKNGLVNLEKVDWKVDYIITHTPSTEMMPSFEYHMYYDIDILMNYLEEIRRKVNYKYWFCGHMHTNLNITDKDICLYEQIIKII